MAQGAALTVVQSRSRCWTPTMLSRPCELRARSRGGAGLRAVFAGVRDRSRCRPGLIVAGGAVTGGWKTWETAEEDLLRLKLRSEARSPELTPPESPGGGGDEARVRRCRRSSPGAEEEGEKLVFGRGSVVGNGCRLCFSGRAATVMKSAVAADFASPSVLDRELLGFDLSGSSQGLGGFALGSPGAWGFLGSLREGREGF